ncbi:hypothetical protein DES41_111176 [Pseudorhodoferax soli]|uniref:Uncharacterized protein n=1 Tax=Pseudorhodoferax soli TaxID=545864 RepID=A0A368XGS0_9BURK|nr:hypothetical protein DES41_111176 [Pseudorhodoferax soli]
MLATGVGQLGSASCQHLGLSRCLEQGTNAACGAGSIPFVAVVSAARMVPLDQLAQHAHAGSDVDRGRAERAVPQEGLQGPQVHAAVLQVGRERMAQHVRRHEREAGGLRVLAHELAQMGVAHAHQRSGVHEHGIGLLLALRPRQKDVSSPAQVLLEPVPGVLAVDHQALARALAGHGDGAFRTLELVQSEPHQLIGPQACCIEQLEHRAIAQSEGRCRVWRRQKALNLRLRRRVGLR